MKAIIRSLICLVYSNIKFFFIKLFHFKKFHYSLFSICSPFSEVEVRKGQLFLSRKLKMRSNTHIRVRENAKLTIGKNFSMNYGCMLVSHEFITIGDDVILGPNVLIYDHDHDFSYSIKENKFTTSPIKIGSNVWIGANSIILKGSEIGNNVVIGASCVVKGKIDDESIIVQDRKVTNLNK